MNNAFFSGSFEEIKSLWRIKSDLLMISIAVKFKGYDINHLIH